MSTMTADEICPGAVLNIKNQPWIARKVEFAQSTTGVSMVHVYARNLLKARSTQHSFAKTDTVELYDQQQRMVTFDHVDGTTYHFMDKFNFALYSLEEQRLRDLLPYFQEGMEDECLLIFGSDAEPMGLELPRSVRRKVSDVKLSTREGKSSNTAVLSGGAEIEVTSFVQQGELIKIDTVDGSYVGPMKRP